MTGSTTSCAIEYYTNRRDRELEKQNVEYARELREELEDDWAEDKLRITYEHVLRALGISLPLTDEQHDDGLTQDDLEHLLEMTGYGLTTKQWCTLEETVIRFYYDERF
jgi:hypothetical protein